MLGKKEYVMLAGQSLNKNTFKGRGKKFLPKGHIWWTKG